MKTIDWAKLAGLATSTLVIMGAAHAQPASTTTTTTEGTSTTTTTGSMTSPDMSTSTTGSTGTMQGGAMSGGSMSGGMMNGGMMMSQPMTVTGTVVRYYADRSGYVTAMDVATPDGVKMAHFSPGMAQRLYATYPVGSQITVQAVSMSMGKMTSTNVVGVGDTAPASPMPYTATDVQLLEAPAFINIGAPLSTVQGTLSGVVTNDMGEVLGLIVSNNGSRTLVRIPREFRATGDIFNTVGRSAPVIKGADIGAVGYQEATRYGALSAYSNRIIASTLTINGRSYGPGSIAPVRAGKGDTILGLNLFGTPMGVMDKDQTAASSMGFMTYTPGMTMGDMSSSTGMMGSSTSTDTTAASTDTTSTPATTGRHRHHRHHRGSSDTNATTGSSSTDTSGGSSTSSTAPATTPTDTTGGTTGGSTAGGGAAAGSGTTTGSGTTMTQ
jgi:hypothetical protein